MPYLPEKLLRMKTPSGSNIGDIGECGSRLAAMELVSNWLASPESEPFHEVFDETLLDDELSIRGTRLHDRLAQVKNIDFARLTAPMYVVPREYLDMIREHNRDEYFVFRALVQRDISISEWIRRCNESNPGNPIIGFEAVHQDDRRLAGALKGIGVTALPDLVIFGRHRDGTYSNLILDYKTGRGYDKPKTEFAKVNGVTEQLASLSVLGAQNRPGTISSTVGLITPTTLDKGLLTPFSMTAAATPMTTIPEEKFEVLEDRLSALVRNGMRVRDEIKAAPEEMKEEIFEKNAKVGSACTYCPALGNCPKLRKTIAEESKKTVAAAMALSAVASGDSSAGIMLRYAKAANTAAETKSEKTRASAEVEMKKALEEFEALSPAQKTEAVRDLSVLAAASSAMVLPSVVNRHILFAEAFVKHETSLLKAQMEGETAKVGYSEAKVAKLAKDSLTVRELWNITREVKGEGPANDPFAGLDAAATASLLVKLHNEGKGWGAADAHVAGMISRAELERFRSTLNGLHGQAKKAASHTSPVIAKEGKSLLAALGSLAAHAAPKFGTDASSEYCRVVETNAVRFSEFSVGTQEDSAILSQINNVRLAMTKGAAVAGNDVAELYRVSEDTLRSIAELESANGVETIEAAKDILSKTGNVALIEEAFNVKHYAPKAYVYSHVRREVSEALEREPEELSAVI